MTEARTTEDRIIVEIHIAAPPEAVFDALTDPDRIVEWWGDEEYYETEEAEVELRVGGRWRAAGRNSDGSPFSVTGEYRDVERPRLLSYTWDPTWAEWEREEPSLVTISLEPETDGTRLTLVHEGFAGYEKDREDHAEGWPFVLELLKEHLE
ncbi:MAG: SRPBCC domain-containing protein [Gemmatimonadota bacterium]|nr:SRPBCC domain-containing protein [Gemmatimonadota bacterium]